MNYLFNELLKEGKTVKISVRGMSMFPFLLTNDIVLVKPAKAEDIKYGNIVVFKSGENIVLHRMVGKNIKSAVIYTRGDGLLFRDKPVKFEQISGVVARIEKSRWMIAKISIGICAPIWAFVAPITGPVFRAVVKIYEFFKNCRA